MDTAAAAHPSAVGDVDVAAADVVAVAAKDEDVGVVAADEDAAAARI